jgi:predicted acylesterase/phospholipase RssA
MGLTLIRKSPAGVRVESPHIALVLAGGAVTGGAFKVGGLLALDDFLVDRKITDLDTYVGLSAGAFLAVTLAAGISPEEMVKVLDGSSRRFDQLRPLDFYRPNFSEFMGRPLSFAYAVASFVPGVLLDAVRGVPDLAGALLPALRSFAADPTYANAEHVVESWVDQLAPTRRLPALAELLPSGLFDNSGLERWLSRNLARIDLPNDFPGFHAARGRKLYLTACDLDSAERVVFGADERCDLSITEAVQASTALPLFYRPPRVGGADYVDGGVRHTANIDVAIDKGADLIICYNPFRPFNNRTEALRDAVSEDRYLKDRGLPVVLNQVFRTLLHSRLTLGLEHYARDERFRGDIVLIEPEETDADFFAVNPLAFWRRAESIRHGFESVHRTLSANLPELAPLLADYGLTLDPRTARRRAAQLRRQKGWDPGIHLVATREPESKNKRRSRS